MGDHADVAALREENARLRAEVEQFGKELKDKELLLRLGTGAVLMLGYLERQDPFAMAFFGPEWKRAYCVLSAVGVFSHHGSHKEISFNPRGFAEVKSLALEWYGASADCRFHCFSLVDSAGTPVYNLRCESREEAERWRNAFATVGCEVRLRDGQQPKKRFKLPKLPELKDLPNLKDLPDNLRKGWKKKTSVAGSAAASPAPGSPSHAQGTSHAHHATHHAAQHGGASLRRTSQDSTASTESSMSTVSSQAGAQGAARKGLPAGVGRRVPAGPAEVQSAERRAEEESQSEAEEGPSVSGRATLPGPQQRGPMRGSTPVHTASKYSPLSSQGVWEARHEGLFNLGMIILVVTHCRLILENLLKYGMRFNVLGYVRRALDGDTNYPIVACFPFLLAASLVSLYGEKLAYALLQQEQRQRAALMKRERDSAAEQALRRQVARNDRIVASFAIFTTSAVLLLPCAMVSIHGVDTDPRPGMVLMLCTLTAWMKLVSYHHCHWDLRMARRAGEIRSGERGSPDTPAEWGALRYPENLSPGNMLYFMAAPTLCYQVNFPRSDRFRKRWFARRLGELLAFSGLFLFIADQYMEPTIQNSLKPLAESDWGRILERLLKLAIPNTYLWLCMFYLLFHLWLNILGELTRFGDREFYRDWWNAATLGDYWRLWNMPVHKWLLRTVYFPAIRLGVPRFWAVVTVFFVSAVAHELCMGIPLHMRSFWAFIGIMGQVPLIMATEKLKSRIKNETWGNYVFWVTFVIVGQPAAMLLYYHDWAVKVRGILAA